MTSLLASLESTLRDAAVAAIPECTEALAAVPFSLEVHDGGQRGDITSDLCVTLAQQLSFSPRDIAARIWPEVQRGEFISAESANGYFNFRVGTVPDSELFESAKSWQERLKARYRENSAVVATPGVNRGYGRAEAIRLQFRAAVHADLLSHCGLAVSLFIQASDPPESGSFVSRLRRIVDSKKSEGEDPRTVVQRLREKVEAGNSSLGFLWLHGCHTGIDIDSRFAARQWQNGQLLFSYSPSPRWFREIPSEIEGLEGKGWSDCELLALALQLAADLPGIELDPGASRLNESANLVSFISSTKQRLERLSESTQSSRQDGGDDLGPCLRSLRMLLLGIEGWALRGEPGRALLQLRQWLELINRILNTPSFRQKLSEGGASDREVRSMATLREYTGLFCQWWSSR